jgi:6-phosphogluconolactonase
VVLTGDGGHVLVANAASHDVSVFAVDEAGLSLIGRTPSGGSAPRSVAEHDGLVFVMNRGKPSSNGFRITSDGLTPVVGAEPNGRSEICWAVVSGDGRFAFTTNFADGAVSAYEIGMDGSLTLNDATAGTAIDGTPGLRDEDLSAEGRFLYAIDADGGRVYGWAVGSDGTLSPIGSWEGIPATVAGLAAR